MKFIIRAGLHMPAVILVLLSTGVRAGSFEMDNGLTGEYTLTLGYGVAARTEEPADELVNGPIDPVTGLPTTINFDDGDRNFDKGAVVNNRATALGELSLGWRNYGLVLRGDAFYDGVYHRSNDNDSPQTVNKSGPHDEFSDDAEKFSGGRARVLDAYVFGDWTLGNMDLNVRLGRQVVAWGETLFFSGIAIAQGPVDATKTNVPNIEVKSILLPIEQVSAQLGVTEKLSLMGYYRLKYEPTELEPVGSFFSTVDLVGPGAEFIYGFRNPFYDPLANPNVFTPAELAALLNLVFPGGIPPVLPGTIAGLVPGARPLINIPRADDIEPDASGQYGLGMKYQLTPATDVGLYALKYHDTLPVVQLNLGFPELATGVTTAPQQAPVSYNITYFDDIKLVGASVSTKLADISLAGEVLRRDGANVLVRGPFGATSTRAKVSQAFGSAVYLVPPNFISRQIALVGELGYIRVDDVEPLAGGEDELIATKDAWATTGIVNFSYPNVFPKWDLSVPVSFAAVLNGTPAMAGAMGSLIGEDDRRLGLGANFIYLQNLQVGLNYNAFLGSPDLSQRPFQDRDYAAVNVKYSF